MRDWETWSFSMPRGTTRGDARRFLTEQAEYGHWELARVRLYPDGRRHIELRRRVIKAVRTA